MMRSRHVVAVLLFFPVLTLLMLIFKIGPAWPDDLFTRIWLFTALAGAGGGGLYILLREKALLRKIFLGFFILSMTAYSVFTVLSINRMAGRIADENRMGDVVDDIYKKREKR